ncbi:hypothetical protein J6590_026226 [Homalodisca vitripennis]|nr:hypothetical protein J6590_026226 [Homalodisca vitripennis]
MPYTSQLPEDLNPETKRLTSPPVTGRQLKSREGAAGVLCCSRSTAEDDGRERLCRISSAALMQYLLKVQELQFHCKGIAPNNHLCRFHCRGLQGDTVPLKGKNSKQTLEQFSLPRSSRRHSSIVREKLHTNTYVGSTVAVFKEIQCHCNGKALHNHLCRFHYRGLQGDTVPL